LTIRTFGAAACAGAVVNGIASAAAASTAEMATVRTEPS